MPRGGSRPGSGHPSKFQMEQKEAAAKEKLTASKAKRKAALAATWDQIEIAAAAGERWACQLLIEHSEGRPTQKAQVQEDFNVRLIHRWLRKPLPCPFCHKIIRSFEEKAAPDPDLVEDEAVVILSEPYGEEEEEDNAHARAHEADELEEWEDPFA
jgi:hypothetical protein